MAREQLTREEAINILTKKRDELDEITTKDETICLLLDAGDAVGYTPAMRCLVRGSTPEDSIHWGK